MTAPDGVRQLGDVTADVRETADVVVIGTGAAGAVAAYVLAEAGLDVLMLEEGPWVEPSEFRRDAWSAFKGLWRDAGFQVAEGRSFTPILQGCAVGGSTVTNGAIVHRVPEAIHAEWARSFGADELLSMTALERAYDRLDIDLEVAPAPEAVLGRNNTLMRDGAEAMGIKANAIRRNVRDCEGSAGCLQGCRRERKRSMNFTFVPRALALGARLFATCRVERIEAVGGRAVAVRGRFRDPRTGETGKSIRVEVRRAIVLAASAIQTPMLLATSGIGRGSGVLGQRLQCHPGAGVLGVFERPVDMWFGATQGFETTHWWDERMKMETVGMPVEIGASRVPGFGPTLMRNIADFGHLAQWGVQVRSDSHGRVFRGLTGRTVIRYGLSEADVRQMKLGLKRLTEMMFLAGATKVLPGVHGLPDEIDSPAAMAALDDLPDDPRLFHAISSHMFGTAVMGRSARGSVVGPDLQCHDAKGLYVVDSSVFPTNMGVNPAHTISAVAMLAAEMIADRNSDART